MKLSRYLSLCVSGAAVGLVCSMASPAQAVVITWNANNITFQNGATLTGSFNYDTNQSGVAAFTAVNLTLTDGGAILFPSPLNFTSVSQFFSRNSTSFILTRTGGFSGLENYVNISLSSDNFGNASSSSVPVSAVAQYGSLGGATSVINMASSPSFTQATPVPFDTPVGATITSVSSMLALGVIKNKRRKMALKTQLEQPMVTK